MKVALTQKLLHESLYFWSNLTCTLKLKAKFTFVTELPFVHYLMHLHSLDKKFLYIEGFYPTVAQTALSFTGKDNTIRQY